MLFVLCCHLTDAQQVNKDSIVDNIEKNSLHIDGYVNGVLIKNIAATYTTIKTETMNGSTNQLYDLNFDYGQQWNREKELKLKDKNGKMLIFRSLGHLLNFLDQNNWMLLNVLQGEQSGKSVEFIFTKKSNN